MKTYVKACIFLLLGLFCYMSPLAGNSQPLSTPEEAEYLRQLFPSYSPELGKLYQSTCYEGCMKETAAYTSEDNSDFCQHMCQCQYETMERELPYEELADWLFQGSPWSGTMESIITQCADLNKHRAKGDALKETPSGP